MPKDSFSGQNSASKISFLHIKRNKLYTTTTGGAENAVISKFTAENKGYQRSTQPISFLKRGDSDF